MRRERWARFPGPAAGPGSRNADYFVACTFFTISFSFGSVMNLS